MKLNEVFDFLSGGPDIVKRHAPTIYNLDINSIEEPKNWGIFVGNRQIGGPKTKKEAIIALKNPMLLKLHGKRLEAKRIS